MHNKFLRPILVGVFCLLIFFSGCVNGDPDDPIINNTSDNNFTIIENDTDNGDLDDEEEDPYVLSSSVQKDCPDSCDDSNSCTADICGKKTGYECVYISLDGSIDDCSGEYSCEAGECVLSEAEEMADIPGFSVQAPELEAVAEEPLNQKTAKWTFFVYLDADNDLEGAGILDINEMEIAGSTDDVNIVVQMDRHPSNDYYGGYDGSNGDWSTTKIFYVLKDSNMEQIKSKEIKDLGEVNMGDGETLKEFLLWGIENYPAEHYAVVLWNHGSGFGVAFDYSSNDDSIGLSELEYAMEAAKEKAGKKIDIVGFDACLMGMLEVDYALKDSTLIRVGSEETEPYDGWDYSTVLTDLINDPSMDADQFSKVIVDRYYESYQDTYDAESITQSAVDLTKLNEALVKLNLFSEELQLELQAGGSNTVLYARNGVEEYASEDTIDLIDFATIIKRITTNPNLKASASELINSLNSAVLHEKAGSYKKYSHGIALYFPSDKYYYDSTYSNSAIGKEKWDEFLDQYLLGSISIDPTLDVKDFSLSANSVSPSDPITISAVISGENIDSVDLYVIEELDYEDSIYQVVIDTVHYNPPSYELDDGSHITTWVGGDNYFEKEWNAYGSAITDGTNYVFTTLFPSGRESSQYYVEGIYQKGSESFNVVMDFDIDSGEMISIHNVETYYEVIPTEGDSFTLYKYALDEFGYGVNIPSDTIVYGADGFAVGHYPLSEGSYYLALFAYDISGNKDHEGAYINVKKSDPQTDFCSDGTEEGECSISPTYAGYLCTNGELIYNESCITEWTCSDGTSNGECSQSSEGYLCINGFLEYNSTCVPDPGEYCDDGTPYGECSYWYDGWKCVNGEYEYDLSCYAGISTYSCDDGTEHGKCSLDSQGYICYYGELYEDSYCIGSCEDGTLNNYCSQDSEGYLCVGGTLELNSLCDADYYYYCWDNTVAGYCSQEYLGYYCAYDGELYYDESCNAYYYGTDCSDGTPHGLCSIYDLGLLCLNGELTASEECGYIFDFSCSDGTLDGYCSDVNAGSYCSQGELIENSVWCVGSCSDGTLDGYCSDYTEGYICSNGELVYSTYCTPQSGESCWDGTLDGYCSEVNVGYACYGGYLYYDSYCDEYYDGYCTDGTLNGYCSSVNPGYSCVDGELIYVSDCEDYTSYYCSDGTSVGYCSDAYPGYWCNDYAQLEYNELCGSDVQSCSDGTEINSCSPYTLGYWCNSDGELVYDLSCGGTSDDGSCYDWYFEEYVQPGKCSSDNLFYCHEGYWFDGDEFCYDPDSLCSDGTQIGYCSEATSGYWCNYFNELELDPECEILLNPNECIDGTEIGSCSPYSLGYLCTTNAELEYNIDCGGSSDDGSCYDWYFEEYIESGKCTSDDLFYCYEGQWFEGEGYCY